MANASEYLVNNRCIIGMPSCGYGFSSARLCFIARPADDEFQLETDILTAVLKERNYEAYVAMQRVDPGNFAFCTKICSKIITAQFCIVLLNRSKDHERPEQRIPNPNVHFEYGMMLSFHKSVIPMQRDTEKLPFNIFPIDTIKYNNGNFKARAEAAIDEIIVRQSVNAPAPAPGTPGDVLRYFAFKGMRYTDTINEFLRFVFVQGQIAGFNLFNGTEGFIYFGNFHNESLREIAVRIKLLMTNIATARAAVESQHAEQERQQKAVGVYTMAIGTEQKKPFVNPFDRIAVEVLVPESADIAKLTERVAEFQSSILKVDVKLIKPSGIESALKAEYDKVAL